MMLRSLCALLSLSTHARRRMVAPVLFMALLLMLGACGASTSTATTASYNASNVGNSSANASNSSSDGAAGQPAPYATAASKGGSNPGSSGGSSGQPTLPNGTPVNAYLIRSLTLGLQVNKPLDAEQQITKDIFALDAQAQAAGEQISQAGDGSYSVSLTFAVSSPKYDAVKGYLETFANSHSAFQGKLTSEAETVQNVTSQYVDLQSRLTNLRTEQQRLLQLLSQAQSLADTLTIQDKLTDVEGQIEQIEGQINQLDSQTSYSTITINIAANQAPAAPAPVTPASPWNPLQILGAAGSALLVILQIMADVLIWVLVFAPLWLPPLAIYLWRWRKLRRAVPPSVRFGLSSGASGGSGVVGP